MRRKKPVKRPVISNCGPKVLQKALHEKFGDIIPEVVVPNRTGKVIPAPKKSGSVKFQNCMGNPVDLWGQFHGLPVFLILSGPSLNTMKLSEIRRVKAQSFGVNNSWGVFEPDFWTHADGPDKFLYSKWKDPNIMKFCPSPMKNRNLRTKSRDGIFMPSEDKPRDCPNTVFYPRNLEFDHVGFLSEDTVNWGNPGDKECSLGYKGARSVMLAALKLCYVLGFRTIYLCGADFKMEKEEQNYAFEQDRSSSSVRGNNASYNINKKRLSSLHPLFLEKGMKVYNCNLDSGLKVFPFLPFPEAISRCESLIPSDEGTLGWYDGENKKKDKVKIKRN
jgi:hypothetical protein